ncbi:MAG: hypothetical protein PV344_01590, partial [Anaplasma sp.]|nr:hypothetical protein [Anaplasma sp.]
IPGSSVFPPILRKLPRALLFRVCRYCKRLNFCKDLIFTNFTNRPLFAKNRSREQFGHYVNTTEATFDLRKLEPANN